MFRIPLRRLTAFPNLKAAASPRPLVFAVLAVSLGWLASCSQPEQVVNVYSARHYDVDRALYETFTERTGIQVRLIEGGSDELIERMRTEGDASPADILITVDAGRLWRAKEAGVLKPIASDDLLAAVPPGLLDADSMWVGLSRRVRGIAYHKDRVDPGELTGILDLADPEWKGRICVRSSGNIYNQSLVASLIAMHGMERTEQWAAGFVSNLSRAPVGGDTDQLKAIAAGICDIALVNHYYLARLIASDDPAENEIGRKIGLYFPPAAEGGAHVNVSGAGLAKHAPNRENAIAFLLYLTEDASQLLFTERNFELPIRDGAPRNPVLDPFGDPEPNPVSLTDYGVYNADAVRLMDRVGWR